MIFYLSGIVTTKFAPRGRPQGSVPACTLRWEALGGLNCSVFDFVWVTMWVPHLAFLHGPMAITFTLAEELFNTIKNHP